jgi:hypothetical protein
MAWIFSLSAECGPTQNTAEQFSRHFAHCNWTLSNGTQSRCRTSLFQDLEDNWWCRVCPDQMSEIGIEAPEAAFLMTEIGLLLYQTLQSAPAFRYAIVGVEVDEFRTYPELLDETSAFNLPGLVISDQIYQSCAFASTFQPFKSGYRWQPYDGEVYRPLRVSSLLKEQMHRLLAA